MVPTTTQLFAHSERTYLRNYLSGGPTLQRAAILWTMLVKNELATRLLSAAEACLHSGGYFHLWGHSWELDEHDLWDELDRFLGRYGKFARNSSRMPSGVPACVDSQGVNARRCEPGSREPARRSIVASATSLCLKSSATVGTADEPA